MAIRGLLACACVFVILSLAACGVNGGGSAADPPTQGPFIGPRFLTAVRNPVDPALQYINNPGQVSLGPNGDFLVTDVGTFDRKNDKVVEITPTGHVVWALFGPGLDFVHSAYLTSRGTLLIADTNNNRVIEVDRSGNIQWNSDDLGGGNGYLGHGRFSDGGQLLYPNDAKELPNGHFLISSRMNSTVYEINRDGHVYWKCQSFINLEGKPDHLLRQHNPHRLPNGDTLIADSDNARIVEVNPSCTREVWEYGGTNDLGSPNIIWPRDANLIDNFNNNGLSGRHYDANRLHHPSYVLVDDSKHDRVLLVTHDRHPEIVREWRHLNEPYSETVLGNDTFLVGSGGVHGVDVFSLTTASLIGVVSTRPPMSLPAKLIDGGFEPMADQVWTRDDLLIETLPPGIRADMTFDTKVKHTGKSSARIHWSHGSHLSLWWGQAVAVKMDHRYRFTGWIKTRSVAPCPGCNQGPGTVNGSTAYYDLLYLQPGPYKPPSDTKVLLHTGTEDWTQDSLTFDVPDGTVGLSINATLDGRGTAWFDDVTLKDLGPTPAGSS